MQNQTRRQFLTTAAAMAAALVATPRRVRARGPHPAPRTGITGAKVATSEQLKGSSDLIPLFDDVRAIPEIVDGIRCNCGCAGQPGKYSLLSCYEGANAMAMDCPICQGEGRLAARLNKAGKTLDEIRAAIDAQFA